MKIFIKTLDNNLKTIFNFVLYGLGICLCYFLKPHVFIIIGIGVILFPIAMCVYITVKEKARKNKKNNLKGGKDKHEN